MSTHLVLVEGIPGSGKTTTAHSVRDWLAERGFSTRLHLEGDLDHPADYESVASMNREEYTALLARHPAQRALLEEHAVAKRGEVFIGYRKLRERYPDQVSETLFQDLACHEVYELPMERYERVYREKWQDFTAKARNGQDIYIFECCFLQNLLTTLLARHNLDAPAATKEALRVAKVIQLLDPLLIYLEPPDVRHTLERAAANRPAEWLEFVIGYITGQAWGKANHENGFNGMVHFYEYRRDVEREVFRQLRWRKLWIVDAGMDWPASIRQVTAVLENGLGGNLA
jgi:hypothetical protein